MKLIRRYLLIINLFFTGLLLGCYLAAFISPAKFWPPVFLGFLYPYVAGVNFCFVLLWIPIRWPFSFISMLGLVSGYYFAAGTYQFKIDKKETPADGLRVMSYNVRLFDLYNWSNNRKTRDSIISFIKEQKPDILTLQEFYSNDDGYHVNAAALSLMLDMPYYQTHYTITKNEKQHWGIATYSRFPIVKKHVIKLENSRGNTCIASDVCINSKDTIRVFNMHLQSIALKQEDYRYIDLHDDDNSYMNDVDGSKNILRKVRNASIKRAAQCEKIAASIGQSRHDVLVCGDFNDTPVSYTYQQLSSGLKDAFKESGQGFGKTYNGILPSYRIDYILASKGFQAGDFITHRKSYSDHFPISCVVWKEE